MTVDKHSNTIRLVHYTTHEYLKSQLPNAENEIAVSCVTYLSFDRFAVGLCSTREEFSIRLQENPLYKYAARNWGHHASAASIVESLILDFLESEAKVSACAQALAAFGIDIYDYFEPTKITGIHLAAYF